MAQLPADHPDKNRHHTESNIYRSQQEFDEAMFGRGAGDPDVSQYYPGEEARLKANGATLAGISPSYSSIASSKQTEITE